MSNVKKEYEGTVVDPRKPLMIKSWRRTKLPYEQMRDVLKVGHAYFIGGVKRQTAHNAAKALTKKLKFKVIAVSGLYEGEKGYVFFKEGPEEWVKKGVEEGWLKED